jgi:hypothetical protein
MPRVRYLTHRPGRKPPAPRIGRTAVPGAGKGELASGSRQDRAQVRRTDFPLHEDAGPSRFGHRGLEQLPNLAEQRFVGSLAPCSLPRKHVAIPHGQVSFGGDYGWPIGQDDGTWRLRGFDAHKRIKGRKRHILVDTLGPTGCQPCRIGGHIRSAGWRSAAWRAARVVSKELDSHTDASHQSRKLAWGPTSGMAAMDRQEAISESSR